MSYEIVLWICISAILCATIGAAWDSAILASLIPVAYIRTLGADIAAAAYATVEALPWTWYPLAVLSVLPSVGPIPIWACTAYLAAYCLLALAVCNSVPEKKTPIVPSSHIFTGVKIAGDRRHGT